MAPITAGRKNSNRTPFPDANSIARDLAIALVQSTIVDVPTVRCHKLPQTSIMARNYITVQISGMSPARALPEPLITKPD
ncbi:hypothetical protein [Roseomonas chloroacetimidivorans]|uniref:hypothetical protein n=1 Tax=Roseomonas chloroacetimidivorans TaxID=1766656 RepID=UPI003C7845BB